MYIYLYIHTHTHTHTHTDFGPFDWKDVGGRVEDNAREANLGFFNIYMFVFTLALLIGRT